LEFRQLEYFQRTGRIRSVTKAAGELHVSQPSITVAIQKLEAELGVKLFDRSQKQIALTPEGQVCLERTDDILARMRDLISEMNDYRSATKGIIKIGITPVIGAYFFPAALARFQRIHPRVQVVVIEEGSLALRKRLARGELDLTMMITSKTSSHLETVPVAKGQLLACFARHNPLAKLREIPFASLRDQPFIMFREDTYSRQVILDECARNKFTPRIVFSSSQIETVMGMVGQGVGIAFLLDAIVTKYPEVVGRPLTKPILIEAGLAWSKDRYQSKAARLLMHSFLEAPRDGAPVPKRRPA
jgi:DNA-binding transcriptional LysR family regulator